MSDSSVAPMPQIVQHARADIDRKRDNPNGDVFDNTVVDNLIAPVDANAVGMLLQSKYPSTGAFGVFDRNRYFDRNAAVVVRDVSASARRDLSLLQWQTAANAPSGHDAKGTATSTADRAAPAAKGTVRSAALINASAETVTANCPFGDNSTADCAGFARLGDDTAVTWPLSLPRHNAVIVYARDPVPPQLPAR